MPTKINMVTGQKKISKIFDVKNFGGMGTQAPLLKTELAKRGYDVDIEGEGLDYDIIHLHTPLFSPLKIKKIKNKKIPFVIHARHLPELVLDSFKGAKIIHPIYYRYSRWYYDQADVTICASKYSHDILRELGATCKIVQIPNGISRERFYPDEKSRQTFREKHGFGDNDVVIINVGLRIARKGIFSFIETAKALLPDKKFKFIWVGGGEVGLDTIKVDGGMPENIEFIEYVPFEEMNGAYNGSDIFFFPTYAESYGNVPFEAAAAGKVLIIRDIKIYQQWFVHNENCLKAKTDDEFVRAIQSVPADAELRQKLTAGAIKLAEDHDHGKTLNMLADMYDELLKGGK